MFQYNRLDGEKLVRSFRDASISRGAIVLPGYEMEIYIRYESEMNPSVMKKYGNRIAEILRRLPDMDNAVQRMCEAEYAQSHLGVENYLFSIAYIQIMEDRINLEYWGDVVNSSFSSVFRKIGSQWVMQD